jgi:hypothetical protein
MADKEQPPATTGDQPPAPQKAFKPRRIKPSDHAKYYIVKQGGGKPDLTLPLDANENRRQRQLDSAEYRGLIKEYMGEKHQKRELQRMKPQELKRLGEALKIADELDRNVWVDDIPLKPRTGAVEDLQGLMEKASGFGSAIKKRREKQAEVVIDAESSDVTAEATGTE